MNHVFHNPQMPESHTSVKPFMKYTGQTEKDVKNWLSFQEGYTLHKSVRKKFLLRKTFAKTINDLFQADIVDMQNLSRFNDGFRYILTCIDVFSKYAYAIPVKDKSGRSIASAFEKIFADRIPLFLQTDQGTEFYNAQVQSVFNKHKIHHYSTFSEYKAAVVERFNLTIKRRIFKYLTHKRTSRWIDVLDDLIHSYNNTFHRTIGVAPVEVSPENEKNIAQRMYPPKPKLTWKFKKGDKVRISKQKTIFEKGYLANWTDEVFIVSDLYPTFPVTYGLTDLLNEPINGKFYEQELQLVGISDVFAIDKVIKTRRRNGQVEYFVKWRGYPEKFNSWTTNVQ